MVIQPRILIGDDLLDWLNVLSSEERKQVQQSINHAKEHCGSIFIFAPIAERRMLLSFSILMYCADENHAIIALLYETPCSPQGRAELEKFWNLFTAGGFPE